MFKCHIFYYKLNLLIKQLDIKNYVGSAIQYWEEKWQNLAYMLCSFDSINLKPSIIV